MRSGPISVMPYIRGTFRVFTDEVYLVVDMNERSCSCMSWQMSCLPCAHACAVIRYSKQDVYDYVDTCFLLSTHNLIYSGQFQPLATHNMPKPSDDGSFLMIVCLLAGFLRLNKMHRQGRQQSATDASSTTSVCLIALMYCNCYIIFIMCNVNINLTLQFFFPNFFIIYKILTSPFLGYSCRSALY